MVIGRTRARGASRRSPGWLVPPVRAPLPVMAALGLLGLIWTAFLTGTFLRSGSNVVWDEWIYDGLSAGSALLVVSRAVKVRSERLTWSLIGAGLLVTTVGDITGSLLLEFGAPALRRLPDVLCLSMYPCLYTGVVLLLRDRMRRFPASAWLDGVVAGAGLAAVVAAAVFGRIMTASHGSALAVVAAVAYPIGDLVLLATVAGALAMIGWRADARWWSLSLAFALYAVVDTLYVVQAASGSYRGGTWMDAVWPAASLLVAVTAWRPTRRMSNDRFTGWPVLLPSMASTLGAVGVLWLGSGPSILRPAEPLAAFTLIAASARFALGFREVAWLAETRRQAQADELTGLAGRQFLVTALGKVQPGDCAGLLLVGLDRFAEINDSLSHQVGDELLVQAARRLTAIVAGQGLVARVGGDEFAVLLTATRDPAGGQGRQARPVVGNTLAPERHVVSDLAHELAGRIVAGLASPFALDDVTLHIQARVGIGLLPDHTTDPQRLFQRGDVAVRAAKTATCHVREYHADDDPHSKERLQLLEELREALRHHRIVCHYQAIVDLEAGVADGVEALARWDHPQRGLLTPERFIPLAEHAGLMREVTHAVLHHALTQVRQWLDTGLPVRVSVNLSPTNLLDLDLPGQVEQALAEHGVPGSMLHVEITETLLMTNFGRSQEILRRLRALGVEASIDDYGTGYSSLSYLQDLEVSELKLDRVFTSRLTRDPRTEAIVRSTVELAHNLGMRLVAEGVGDLETVEALRRLGCDLAQGFHYGRPLRGDAMFRWLTEQGGLALLASCPRSSSPAPAAPSRSASQSVGRTR